MLALNTTLLDLYWHFFFKKEMQMTLKEKEILANLFSHIQMPIKISTHQHLRFQNPQLQKQQGHFFRITHKNNDEELIQGTTLKLMLVNKMLNTNATTLNILNKSEKLQLKYGGTYLNRLDKNKAQKHIQSLLSDALWIRITDAYIANTNNNQWEQNQNTIKNILPFRKMDIIITGADKRNQKYKITQSEIKILNNICKNWTIKSKPIDKNIHDRYIETDKLKILLSSGLYHLSSTSNKDFTYIIEIK